MPPGRGLALTGFRPQLAAMEPAAEILVDSPDVVYSAEAIEAHYEYRTTRVSRESGVLRVRAGHGRRWTPGARGSATHTHSPPVLRCSPLLLGSPSALPGRCPGSGSCL